MTAIISPSFARDKVLASVYKIGVQASLSAEKNLVINGYDIPYDDYVWAFQKFGFVPHDVSLNSSRIGYELWIDGSKYNCYVYNNGSVEFYKNNKIHCCAGPARVTSEGTQLYFIEGQLSNLDGPAIVGENRRETYAIDGKIYDAIGYVENHPRSIVTNLYHSNRMVSIFNYKDFSCVRTAGHEFLLKKATPNLTPQHFLLYASYRWMREHEIVSYKSASPEFNSLYKMLGRKCVDFSLNNNTTYSEMEVIFEDLSSMYLSIDKKNDYIDYEIFNIDGVSIELGSVNVNLYDGIGSESTIDLEEDMKKEDTDKRVADILETLGGVYESTFAKERKDTQVLHGYEVDEESFKKVRHDDKYDIYYWVDEHGDYHSPKANVPGKIYRSGRVEFFKHGYLHNVFGPAIVDESNGIYVLNGREVTFEEHARYSGTDRTIEFKNSNGLLHRENGPAVIKFHEDFTYEEQCYLNGHQVSEEELSYYTNGYQAPEEEHKESHQFEFSYLEDEDLFDPTSDEITGQLDEILNEIYYNKEREQEKTAQKGKSMSKTQRGGPDLSGGRLSQIFEGSLYGVKKGTINGSTELVANKVANMASFEDKEWAKKLIQLALIAGSAEILDSIPEDMADKVGLTYDNQKDVVALLRKVAGENIGRDAVNVIIGLYPYFKDVLSEFTAEDFNAVAEEYEANTVALDPAAQHVDIEDLINDQQVEDVKHEELFEEVVNGR